MSARQGVGGVLPAGPGASAAPQCQLQPGQGLHHEAHHQLPAHEEASQQWSVANTCIRKQKHIVSESLLKKFAAIYKPIYSLSALSKRIRVKFAVKIKIENEQTNKSNADYSTIS